MRRAVFVLLSLAMAASGLAPASARRGPDHQVSAPYQTPVAGVHLAGNKAYYFDCLRGIGCGIIPVGPRDRSVQLEIVDVTGGAVHTDVYVMPGGSHWFTFCGESEKMPVAPKTELLVHVIPGVCEDDSTPSTPVHGTIEATLSSKRI